MDLKNRLLSMGLEESIVLRLLPVITPSEAQLFYDGSDEFIKKKIPELLERIVNKPEIDNELDLDKVGLRKPGQGNDFPIPDVDKKEAPKEFQSFDNLPRLIEEDYTLSSPYSKLKVVFILLIIFTAILVFLLSGLSKAGNDVTVTDKPENPTIDDKLQKPILKMNAPLKKVDLKPINMSPPSYRGSWMFMPWDNFNTKVLCNDGRLKEIKDSYTIQFWLKLTQKFATKVNILELVTGNKRLEVIFINEYGYICFNPGPGQESIALFKPIPDNGRHFHIAVTRDKENIKLFVNGKERNSSKFKILPENNEQGRDFMLLFRSKSTLKGLAIDELMISNYVLFEKQFKPERVLSITESTVLYIPFEKDDRKSFKCYGHNNFSEYTITGGKWLNVQNEVQQVINHIEFSDEPKAPASNPSAP